MYSLYSLTEKLYEPNLENVKEYVISKVSEIYSKAFKIPVEELKAYLKKIPVYVKDLGKSFGGTILGAYSFLTDGINIYNRKIEISPIVLSNPYLLIRTLAEEYAHAVQSYLGFIKRIPYYFFNFFRKITNIFDYLTHPLEREAKFVAKKVLDSTKQNSEKLVYNKPKSFLEKIKDYLKKLYE
ncbi:MAG: hypothetical protein QXQ14_01185 [Candidatus Aenigmatarchaeota archaeon]